MPIVRRAASCIEGILNAKNWNEFGGRLGIYSGSYTHGNSDIPSVLTADDALRGSTFRPRPELRR